MPVPPGEVRSRTVTSCAPSALMAAATAPDLHSPRRHALLPQREADAENEITAFRPLLSRWT